MKKVVLIGAGGHCKVIIDIIKSTNEYEIVGITNKSYNEDVLNVPVIGDDNVLDKLYNDGVKYAFICIGALNNINIRNRIYKKLKNIGFNLPVLIHKTAVVSTFSHIAEGTCIMAGTIINPGVHIEKNCIINTGAIIEHDCFIGYNTHISPKVALAGGVKVGFNTHIGIGSSVIQNIEIGNNVTIGAGAVVINNIHDSVLAVGVPAKEKSKT
ncbi:acetyltransferase, partial [Clostridiaceae bacterium UIB06]|nr:acetyltransferase [Clostridiaceae bacterium UIB06]